MEDKYLYDNKVDKQLGGIFPSTDYSNSESVMKCFKRYKDRIKNVSNENIKSDSFIYALQHSYNKEEIVLMEDDLMDEEKTKYLALINQGEKELLLSAPIELNLKTGKLIKWLRHDKVYLVTKHHITEKTYFKADIKEANYIIKWEDDKDNVYDSWAVVTGPPETKVKSELEGTFYFDRANDSIDIILPQNEETLLLNRYKKVIIKGKAWIIQVYDDITSDNLIKISCIEDYVNPEKDDVDEGVINGKDNYKYRITSALDGLKEVTVGKTLWFDPVLYKDDVEVTDVDFTYTIDSIVGESIVQTGEGGFVTVEKGVVRIDIKPEGYPIEATFIINIVEQVENFVSRFEINGPMKLKQGFVATYSVENLLNGEKGEVLDGEFTIKGSSIKVLNRKGTSITIEGTSLGTSTLSFANKNNSAELQINVTSLFE